MRPSKSPFLWWAIGAVCCSFIGSLSAAQLKENTADIQQDLNIPGMAVTIKRPGGESGCNTANHETWDTSVGGCSNTEYLKENAKVISVAVSSPTMSIAVSGASLATATVRTKDGQPVGAGIPVTWSTSLGSLSSYSGVTNAASQMSVNLSAPKGTAEGTGVVTASAKAGGASTSVSFYNSASVAALDATPPTVLADGASFSTLVATLTYENGASVGAGEPLSWATNLGNLFYTENITNANGQAVAYLASSTPGLASPQAVRKTARATTVTFTSPAPIAPVIESFTVKGCYRGKCAANEIGFDYDISYWKNDNIFTWTAVGADRFELIDQYGELHYSGSATTVNFKDIPIGGRTFASKLYLNAPSGGNQHLTFTLRAYKGDVMVTKSLTAYAGWAACGGGCSM